MQAFPESCHAYAMGMRACWECAESAWKLTSTGHSKQTNELASIASGMTGAMWAVTTDIAFAAV